ncbi:MAG: hypothetical protein IKO05_04820 [Selenomonadaceae bacterium]|nr:hypothetical protein [Selenomonadaceae bacterium]
MAYIYNTASNTLLSGTSKADSIQNGGVWDGSYHYGGSNVTIDAGAGNDSIQNNSGSDVTINGGAGDDSIYDSWVSNVSINGGAGDDSIYNDGDGGKTVTGGAGSDIFIFYYDTDSAYGTDIITDYEEADTIQFKNVAVSKVSTNSSGSVIFKAGDNKLVVKNAADKIITYIDADGTTKTFGQASTNSKLITLTEGNDTYSNTLDGATINALGGNDYVSSAGSNKVTIDGGKGNDTLRGSASADSLSGGAGNDNLLGGKGKDTLTGGNGNDTLAGGKGDDTLTGGKGNDIFVYADGDGDDVITDFEEGTDTVSLDSRWSEATVKGSDVVFKFDTGSLTLKDASGKWIDYVFPDGSGGSYMIKSVRNLKWKLSGTTATYGNDEDTLATVFGVTSIDGLSYNNKVVTVSAASLGTKKVTVSDGCTLALGSDVSSAATKKSWSIKNSTATYKQTTSAGYSLDDNEIIYSKKVSKTLATVTGVTSTDGLSVNKKVITVSKASLGTEKISVSDGYKLKLGSDVNAPSTKKSWSLSNSTTATYKQTTTAGYKLSDNEIIYSKKVSKTLATVKGAKSVDGLKVSGSTVKLAASALSKKVTVSGGYIFDFASDYSKASITGSSSADTIIARGKNISISGGAGADIFALKPTVANVISDYEAADKISLTSGAADFSVSGGDLLINGKVTLKGAADKSVTYIEDGEEKIYVPKKNSDAVKFNAQGTSATLMVHYDGDDFDAANYSSSLVTINASAVVHALTITGNKNANKIVGTGEEDYIDGGAGSDTISGGKGDDTLIGGAGSDSLNGGAGADSLLGGDKSDVLLGGAGNDTLWGNAGDDTLTGGDGEDIFVYGNGDGKDIISDYTSADKVIVLSGKVESPFVDSDGNVTFQIGAGQLVFPTGANQYIELINADGNIQGKYTPKS